MKKLLNKILLKARKTFKLASVQNLFFFDKSPNILLLRQDRLGDLLISTSFIRTLRRHLPNATIDILLSKNNIAAKKCIEKYINKIWILEKKVPKYFAVLLALRRKHYDLIIDLFDIPSTTSGIIINIANPVFALGIDKSNSFIYDYTVPMLNKFEFHVVARLCNLLTAFGINPAEENLKLEYPLGSKVKCSKMRFGINLAGASANRFWGEQNNSELIALLTKHYPKAEIQVFWTPGYRDVVHNLKSIYPHIIADSYSSFDDFARAVAQCSYIISPDTSVVHLCAAFNIPAVIMYLTALQMPHSPWYPYMTQYVAIETTETTLESVKVEEVWKAVEKLIINE